jgi:hypothetical protein
MTQNRRVGKGAHFSAVPHAEEMVRAVPTRGHLVSDHVGTARAHDFRAARRMGARLCPPYGVFALNIVGSEQFIQ